MEVADRDRSILGHIASYCEDIEAAVERFGNSFEVFSSDKEYRNACALCILQIGELSGLLSEEFRSNHRQIPWKEIRAMRNIVAHAYGTFSPKTTWETIELDIPALKAFCTEHQKSASGAAE